jgi:hypothetical protein
MITNSTKGVFALEDTYKKIASGCWVYDGSSDSGASTLWAWGLNYGTLGDNTSSNKSSPIQIPGSQWSGVFSGGSQNFGKKTDGTLWAWGYNGYGQLGAGTGGQSRSSPIQLPGTTWGIVQASRTHTFATKTDGTIWGWGCNNCGQLGDGTTVCRSSPIQVPGTSWNDVSSGARHSAATKTDGTLWSWGDNYDGALGHSNRTCTSSPIQVPGTSWSEISAGLYYTMARKTDGTLWSWGANYGGPLGHNTSYVSSRCSPVQIPGNSWNDICAGRRNSLARKTDGTLWSWGHGQGNSSTNLGHNDIISKSSPVQIPGTSWTQMAGAKAVTLARKTDGTLWAWGFNFRGSVGDGTTICRSSPVQVPGTIWSDISGGTYASFARKTNP